MNAYMYNISASGPYSYKSANKTPLYKNGKKLCMSRWHSLIPPDTDNELLRASCFSCILTISEYLEYDVDDYLSVCPSPFLDP